MEHSSLDTVVLLPGQWPDAPRARLQASLQATLGAPCWAGDEAEIYVRVPTIR